MLYAITGGTGYIGTVLSQRLLAAGETVRILSRKGGADGSREVIAGDICDAGAMSRLVAGADVVVHLAAFVHRRGMSVDEQRECETTNVEGTRTVVDACAAATSRPFLVFVSTASVYGTGTDIDETTPVDPRGAYGRTKAAAERIVLDAAASGRIDAVVLRPAMVFGAAAPGNLGRLIRLVEKGIFPSFQGGRTLKSIVPIGMVVAAIQAVVADRERTNANVYNIAGGTITMRRIAEIIAADRRRTFRSVPVPMGLAKVTTKTIDAIATRLRLPLPSLSQIVDAYRLSLTLSDARLRALPSFQWRHDVETALARSLRGEDLF